MDYSFAGKIAAEVAKLMSEKDFTAQTLVNVNIPNVPKEQIKGMKVTRLGIRRYEKITKKK